MSAEDLLAVKAQIESLMQEQKKCCYKLEMFVPAN